MHSLTFRGSDEFVNFRDDFHLPHGTFFRITKQCAPPPAPSSEDDSICCRVDILYGPVN